MRHSGGSRQVSPVIALPILFAVLYLPPLQADEGTESFPPAIEDNSFFIEEAFNQEERVVQHISNAVHFGSPVRTTRFSFTQEWPLGSQRHQFSYTLPFSWIGGGAGSGFGDVMLNYRYQLLEHDDVVTMAPRVSFIIPSGDEAKGFGAGAPGLQFNLPVSRRLNAHLVGHFNTGAIVLKGVEGFDTRGDEIEETLWSYHAGGSLIGLLTPTLNLMFEVLALSNEGFQEQGGIARSTETIVSPGFRYAINRGSLQIVPGVAVPVSVTDDGTRVGAFLYLSFEHPF